MPIKDAENPVYGRPHHSSKLNENQVIEIRKEWNKKKLLYPKSPKNFFYTTMAKHLKVGPDLIENIVKRRTWTHIPPDVSQ